MLDQNSQVDKQHALQMTGIQKCLNLIYNTCFLHKGQNRKTKLQVSSLYGNKLLHAKV